MNNNKTNKNSTDGFIKLADYGDHPHARGIQRLTRTAAERLVQHHRSLYAKVKRYFSGTPVYIGHPDDPEFYGQPGHTDTRAWAWIHQLEARADGLYALPQWSKKGAELLENAHYQYVSPRWKLLQNPDGTWEPVELLSVGLTNTPNIAGPCIKKPTLLTPAPTKPPGGGNPHDGLGVAEPFSDDTIRLSSSIDESLDGEVLRIKNFEGLRLISSALGLGPNASVKEISEAIKRLTELGESTAAANERVALINAQLDLALERGQIALAERDLWEKRMTDDTTAANELQERPRNIIYQNTHTPFISDTLTPYQSARINASSQFVSAVEQRMSNTGEDFSTAWNAMKEARRDIFLKLNN